VVGARPDVVVGDKGFPGSPSVVNFFEEPDIATP